jgi:hypothetical protein
MCMPLTPSATRSPKPRNPEEQGVRVSFAVHDAEALDVGRRRFDLALSLQTP